MAKPGPKPSSEVHRKTPHASPVDRAIEDRRKRLIRALDIAGMSVYSLAKKLRQSGVKASRNTVQRFLDGKTDNPSVDLFVEAAPILGQSLVWLLTGEQEDPLEDFGWTPPEEKRQDIRETLLRAFPALEAIYNEQEVRGKIFKTWRRHSWWAFFRGEGRYDDESEDVEHQTIAELGKALSAPLRALGYSPGRLTGPALEHYVIAVCQALDFVFMDYVRRSRKERS